MIILHEDESIDWNANGWPEPNPEYDQEFEGYDTDTMPNDIFDQWLWECNDCYEGE